MPHHDAGMRTTLTIDPDVERMLRDAVHATRRSLKEVVNDGLRRALGEGSRRRRRFVVAARPLRLLDGLDDARLDQLADELEVEETRSRLRRRR
jgi:hypothetical protein